MYSIQQGINPGGFLKSFEVKKGCRQGLKHPQAVHLYSQHLFVVITIKH